MVKLLAVVIIANFAAVCKGGALHQKQGHLRAHQDNQGSTRLQSEHKSFSVVKRELLPEYDMNFTLYIHKATGAEILSVESDETNKVFGIAFRTPASDSTGVPHIMEHSVLCGSKKYTVKDPFIQLRRTSLQTYLNAMTYPDRTVYPVASQNLKDFYNLANVYLDAVLHPRAIEDPMVLAQEGWHLELNNRSNPMIFKGIVYNEMKGAYSAPDTRLHNEAMQHLFPDTTYRFDSGGDPKEIPSLTFDRFKSFFSEYYHPGNSRAFFFGDDPVNARLDLIDSYFAEFGKPAVPVTATRVETQRKWKKPKEVEANFPVSKQEAAAKGGAKHSVTLYWLLNEEHLPHTEQLGLSMVNHLLIGTSDSPLYKALIKSGYGDSVTGGGYSDDLKQAMFAVGLKGVRAENVSKVEGLILDTLETVAKDGFSAEAVEATVNSIEFSVREFSTASSNRGMSVFLTAMSSWVYEQDPIESLKFEKPLKEVKASIAAEGQAWLIQLLRKYIISNTARLTLHGVPDSGLNAREEAQEKKRLTDMKTAMKENELEGVVKESAELRAVQKSPDTEEQLKTVPKLKITDLDRKEKQFDIHVGEKQGVPFVTHKVASGGILYANVVLDLAGMLIEHLKILPLFLSLLFDVGTSKLDSAAFAHRIGALTGGIGVSKMNAIKIGKGGTVGDPNDIAYRLVVYGKSTADRADDLFDLMLMGISDAKLDSQVRALEVLRSSKSSIENSLRSAGSSYAQTRVLARHSLAGYLDEMTSGISYYESLPSLLKMAQSDWPILLKQLESLRAVLLQKNTILVDLSADQHTLRKVDGSVEKFLANFSAACKGRSRSDFKGPLISDAMKGKPLLRLSEENEGFGVQTQVNYVVKGGSLYKEGDRISSTTDVVLRLISQSYMWDHVRVLGGAYGGGCSLSRYSGTFSCYSYRDPNLKKTLDVFDGIASYIDGLKLDDETIEQLIIGAVGDLDKPMSPSSQGWVELKRWLLNDSLEVRQKRRDEMFTTTVASFKEFVKHMRPSTSSWRSSIFGSKAAFAKANAALSADSRIPLTPLGQQSM